MKYVLFASIALTVVCLVCAAVCIRATLTVTARLKALNDALAKREQSR